jgi:hypothetical protein
MATVETPSLVPDVSAQFAVDPVNDAVRDSEDQSPSSQAADSTPDTELSLTSEELPELYPPKPSSFVDAKANARRKVATLSLKEQVWGLSGLIFSNWPS